MRLSQAQLIKEYWNRTKERFEAKGITFEIFSDVCKSPTVYIKHIIRKGEFDAVYVKNIGMFIVAPAKVRTMIKELNSQHLKGIVPTEEYVVRIKKLEYILAYAESYSKSQNGEKTDFILIDDTEEGEAS